MELSLPYLVFVPWTLFALVFIYKYYVHQKKPAQDRNRFWSNSYIFDHIPSVFPTFGILCTAWGIIIGLQDFNTDDIEKSIPALLVGLRLAFYATIVGILGLVLFQKICAVVQKSIDDDPLRPPKSSDEITALTGIAQAILNLQIETKKNFESLEGKMGISLQIVNEDLKELKSNVKEFQGSVREDSSKTMAEIAQIRSDSAKFAGAAADNTQIIISAMSKNNELVRAKFDEFSELLRKNNTEALVEVMKRATEEFNNQMSTLINRLVQENFKELNLSVKNLNDWQKENKNQIQELTNNFQRTTESFSITSNILAEVAVKTESLTADNGKLNRMIEELSKVLIEDGKFQEVTTKLLSTVDSLTKSTDSFDQTSNKLNGWVKTQMSFNDKAEVIIQQLEAFKNLNGEVWDKYRSKMEESVGIITKASKSISGDLNNINQQFVESLNSTLTSLDECIQRIVTARR